MPDFIPPMLATLADGAFDDPDWLFEIKWDGYRVQAVVRDGQVRLWTRKRVDAAHLLPGPGRGDAAGSRRVQAIVDGEVVALDAEGRPDFSLLQDRTGLRGLQGSARRDDRDGAAQRPSERRAIPLAYMVFDLLHLDGRSLLEVPLEQRKRALRARAAARTRWCATRPTCWPTASTSRGGQPSAGWRAWWPSGATVRYQPGRRSRDWLKIKLRREQELVVVGWLPGQGSHKDLGSLIVAVNRDGAAAARRAGGQRHRSPAPSRAARRDGAAPPRDLAAGRPAAACRRRAGWSRAS